MNGTSTIQSTLAIHGGAPVRNTLLPYARQMIDESDIQAVVDVLRSDWLTTGPKVAEFEEAFAAWVGAKYAVSFSSGTAALHAAAFAAGLEAGDEAITTPLTFIATANCVLYEGATPVFADVLPDALTLDPGEVASRLSNHTRAILPVDYGGHPAELDPILVLAERHGLVVIEDACHALGAEYRARRVGAIAHMTVFSFHPAKHITTGDGGMVCTGNADYAKTLRRFRNHGISSEARERQDRGQLHYEMVSLGYNYRLTDMACALGIRQLSKLESNLARRRQIAARYSSAFAQIPEIIAPAVRSDVEPAWHLYPIRLNLAKLSASRDDVLLALRAENIGATVHYKPVYYHSYYSERFGDRTGECPVAEDAYKRLISLPMFHGMSDGDVEDVICAVTKIVAHFAIRNP